MELDFATSLVNFGAALLAFVPVGIIFFKKTYRVPDGWHSEISDRLGAANG